MRSIRNRKGFTLIELMIVVVIIGILAAIAIPKFNQASARAKEKEADGILKQVYTLQMTYFANNGEYAADVTELESVGFEEPTNLKHYTWTGDVDVEAGLCLEASGSGYNDRGIDVNGDIDNC